MNSFNVFQIFSVSKFISIFKKKIIELFYTKYYLKKREIIRNPYISEKLIEKILRFSNIEDIRKYFFENHNFAYSKINERENLIKYIKSNCQTELKNYLKYADEITKGKFRIFEKTSNFEGKVNWHYSFFENYNWDLVKSEKIIIHPKNKNIDIKYVWELNRHDFLPYLGFAFFYTGDKKYALIFKNIITNWIQNNPPLYGVNWFSGLEISIRLISWIFSLSFFSSSKEINNNEFFKKIFKSMFLHGYFLRYFYSKKTYNHTIGDIFGVYLFSKAFNKINVLKRWEKKFFKLFSRQIVRQIRFDGTHIEQSVNYHRFVLEFFTLFFIVNHNKIRREINILIERMFNYLLLIMKPNGTFPLIGDSDDGTVLLLNKSKNNLFNNLINLGVILFKRGDLKYISKKVSPISILLFGSKGYETFKQLPPREPSKKMQYFQDAGYFTIRNNWSNKANYLFVDFGEFNLRYGSHCHSDITNLLLCYKGKNILNDSGTFSYNLSWKDRILFRSSIAHNIITVNQKNQARIKSWFTWENLPRVKRNIYFNRDEIKLKCMHDGYENFIVEREILTNKKLSEIVVNDIVLLNPASTKQKIKNVDLFLHFDKEVSIAKLNDSFLINNELIFQFYSKHKFIITLDEFYFSPHYGVKFKSPMLKIHITNGNNSLNQLKFITKISRIDEKN